MTENDAALAARLLVLVKARRREAQSYADNAIKLLQHGEYSAAAADAHRAHQNELVARAFEAEADHLTPGDNA